MNIYRIPVMLGGGFIPTPRPHYDSRYNKRNWIKWPSRYVPHQSTREKARRSTQMEKTNV